MSGVFYIYPTQSINTQCAMPSTRACAIGVEDADDVEVPSHYGVLVHALRRIVSIEH